MTKVTASSLVITLVILSHFSSCFTLQRCGAPVLLSNWPNATTIPGVQVLLTCPLDTFNSCLVDYVEWYRRDQDPRNSQPSSRRLVRSTDRIRVLPFDPMTLFFEKSTSDDQGWYTCVVGNSEGSNEMSTYLLVTERNQARPGKESVKSQKMSPSNDFDSADLGVYRTPINERIFPQMSVSGEQKSSIHHGSSRFSSSQSDGAQRHGYQWNHGNLNSPAFSSAPSVSITRDGHSQTARQSKARSQTTTAEPEIQTTVKEESETDGEISIHRRMDAVYDHIRYIYRRFDAIQSKLNELERQRNSDSDK